MYERILVGTDGSRTAAKAVDRAVELAAATGARLTVLTVGGEAKALLTAESEVARHRESGVAIEAMAIDGDPASVLLDEAERGRYDLLVMGNKGMTGVSRFLMGSVPNKVSHHAASTVLIVRTT
ncbi:MAG TPA: universal stress protein [Acidimicrobiales bacterium]